MSTPDSFTLGRLFGGVTISVANSSCLGEPQFINQDLFIHHSPGSRPASGSACVAYGCDYPCGGFFCTMSGPKIDENYGINMGKGGKTMGINMGK